MTRLPAAITAEGPLSKARDSRSITEVWLWAAVWTPEKIANSSSNFPDKSSLNWKVSAAALCKGEAWKRSACGAWCGIVMFKEFASLFILFDFCKWWSTKLQIQSDIPLSQQSSYHTSVHIVSPNLANFSLGVEKSLGLSHTPEVSTGTDFSLRAAHKTHSVAPQAIVKITAQPSS